jgi:hypothetical protein
MTPVTRMKVGGVINQYINPTKTLNSTLCGHLSIATAAEIQLNNEQVVCFSKRFRYHFRLATCGDNRMSNDKTISQQIGHHQGAW